MNVKANISRAVSTALTGAILAGALAGSLMLATDNGAQSLYFPGPIGQSVALEYVPTTAHTRQATPNKHRGIPPCREEDGSGQRAMCVWDDGRGNVIVNISRKGTDDRTVVLIDRTPGR